MALNFRLIPVVSGENVGGMDAAVEPTGTYSRRFAEEMIRIIRPTCSLRPKVSAIPIRGGKNGFFIYTFSFRCPNFMLSQSQGRDAVEEIEA